MMYLKFVWIIYILCTFFYLNLNSYQIFEDAEMPSPLILVPGDGGSRAYSEVNYRVITLHELVWVNFLYMVFPEKLKTVFKLIYDSNTHKTSDAKGSNVSFPGWGSTETIEELDDWSHTQTTYFSVLVRSLIEDKFYVRNKTLRGAPYDFRKAPNENEDFVPNMKQLIEETYKLSNNQRVVVLGHSMGVLYTLFFLKKMDVTWKKKYVRSFIAVSGPLAGAVKAVTLETSGDNLGSPRKAINFREMQRSFPSTTFMLPRPETFGKVPIVITPTKNYSAYDYNSLFEDMKMPFGSMMYNDTRYLVNGDETPEGVDEIHCIHGYGLPTVRQMIFKSFPNKEPSKINGDGDSTVNINSLEICKKWDRVQYYTIKGADHMGIVGIPEFINRLKQILYRQPKTQFKVKSFKSDHKYICPP